MSICFKDHFENKLSKKRFVDYAVELFSYPFFKESIYSQDLELFGMGDLVYSMKDPSVVRGRKYNKEVIDRSYKLIKKYYERNKSLLSFVQELSQEV